MYALPRRSFNCGPTPAIRSRPPFSNARTSLTRPANWRSALAFRSPCCSLPSIRSGASSWYFNTESWASGVYQKMTELRVDIWRASMVDAVTSAYGGRR